jgi:hypothetical protein
MNEEKNNNNVSKFDITKKTPICEEITKKEN